MIKALIFDFNGVIVESTDVNAQIYAQIFSPYGEEVVHKITQHYQQVGGIPRQARIEMYLRDFAGVRPSRSLVKKLSYQFSQLYLDSLRSAKFVPGAREFLMTYGGLYDKYLSSGAPEKDIPQMLKILDLENFFIRGFGAPKPKNKHIAKIIRKYGYKPSEVVFIGDSPKDCQAAKENNVWFVARHRGLQSLQSAQFKIDDLFELQDVLYRIDNQGVV